MSVVGPRPEQPHYVERFSQSIPRYVRRHKQKAGITGWAQVNGLRGDTSIEERTRYDLYYVENWSLLFDLKIIIKTTFDTLLGKMCIRDRHSIAHCWAAIGNITRCHRAIQIKSYC